MPPGPATCTRRPTSAWTVRRTSSPSATGPTRLVSGNRPDQALTALVRHDEGQQAPITMAMPAICRLMTTSSSSRNDHTTASAGCATCAIPIVPIWIVSGPPVVATWVRDIETPLLAADVVGALARVTRPSPELDRRSRPEQRVAASDRILVPAAAASALPHGVLQPGLQVVVELALRLAPHLDRPRAGPQPPQPPRDEPHLRLDHEDLRVVPEAGVRAGHQEQVRKPGHHRPEVRLHPTAPAVGQGPRVGPRDGHPSERILGREPGAENDDVGTMSSSRLGHDGVAGDVRDRRCLESDVVALKRRVPVARDEQPFATDRVVGRQERAQRSVSDLVLEMGAREALRL